MKKVLVIWMDYAEALIGQQDDGDVRITVLPSEIETMVREEGQTPDYTKFTPFHVSNNENRNHHREQEQVKKYFKRLEDAIKGAGKIYIMGPGEAKKEFSHFIKEHTKNSPEILAVENCERLTEGQLRAKMRRILSSNN
ncbi:MAG: hypothetical protein N2110_06510 [Flavobacteriales bacterium]|nr:hypothetical protein [Flavobacteriales bacterium]MCX7768655.1 hypothetical protein [Flavobacteriales bacterium]MDW8410786.1 hypothetical protein [Flavobacteriales bacterium]